MNTFSQPVEPDLEEMLDVLFRRKIPHRVHHVELFLDREIKEAVCARFDLARTLDTSDPLFETKRDVTVQAFLGYDIFRVGVTGKSIFPTSTISAPDTTALPEQERSARDWQEEHAGPIQGWRDFDAYHWPTVADVDFSSLEWLERNL